MFSRPIFGYQHDYSSQYLCCVARHHSRVTAGWDRATRFWKRTPRIHWNLHVNIRIRLPHMQTSVETVIIASSNAISAQNRFHNWLLNSWYVECLQTSNSNVVHMNFYLSTNIDRTKRLKFACYHCLSLISSTFHQYCILSIAISIFHSHSTWWLIQNTHFFAGMKP